MCKWRLKIPIFLSQSSSKGLAGVEERMSKYPYMDICEPHGGAWDSIFLPYLQKARYSFLLSTCRNIDHSLHSIKTLLIAVIKP